MMKKIYLNIDWMSRSVSVSDKEGFEDWKKYLVEENKCGENKDMDSLYESMEYDFENGAGIIDSLKRINKVPKKDWVKVLKGFKERGVS